MESSATYIALAGMIYQGFFWMEFSEFEKHLDVLEKQCLITATEYEALLDLAKQKKLDLLQKDSLKADLQ
jgi:hypothetical protein